MSLQPAAEIPPTSPLTEREAARLTTKIQLRLDMIADSTELVIPMIEEAKNGNAHQALGYQSWTAYVADKFGGTLARLGKFERLPVVELLAEQGMSTRAIASVVGVSKDTVSRDLRPGVSDETPDHGDAEELVDILAMAGVTEDEFAEIQVMADATKDEFEAALTEARSEDDLSRENVISIISKATAKNTISKKVIPKKVSGIDGKSYTRPAPDETKPRRRSLPDAYWRAVHDLQKSVERLERLHADDRFLVNRKALYDREARRLDNLEWRLSGLDNDLNDAANKCVECDERLVPGDGEPLRNRCSGGCG